MSAFVVRLKTVSVCITYIYLKILAARAVAINFRVGKFVWLARLAGIGQFDHTDRTRGASVFELLSD